MTTAIVLSLTLAHGADLVSTEIALKRPGAYDLNPLMRSPYTRYPITAAVEVAEYKLINKCKTKKCKIIGVGGSILFNGVKTYLNLRKRK